MSTWRSKYGYPRVVARWVMSFLQDRQTSVRVLTAVSQPFIPHRGVPQGSVLGPFLFCLVVNDLHGLLRPSCSSLYMDDTVVWRSHVSLDMCCRDVNASLAALNRWAGTHHLHYNPLKSGVIVFTCRKQPRVQICLGSALIPQVTSDVFLGVQFSCRLSWQPYVTSLCSRVQRCLAVLRALGGSAWGTDGAVLRAAYTAFVLPVLLFGSPFLFDMSPTALVRLHSSAACVIMGLPRSTAIPALLASACLPPLRDLLHERAMRIAAHLSISWESSVRRVLEVPVLSVPSPRRPLLYTLAVAFRRSALGNLCHSESVPHLTRGIIPFWTLPSPDVIMHPFSRSLAALHQIRTISGMLWDRATRSLMVYTDGSRRSPGASFSGFYVPSLNVLRTFALPSYCSSYEAEACAVLLALQFLLECPVPGPFEVVSDCLGFVRSLQSTCFRAGRVTLVYEVLCLTRVLLSQGHPVLFHWVPSHSGVPDNEVVDRAVRVDASVQLSLRARVPLLPRMLARVSRRFLLSRWQEVFREYSGRVSRYVHAVSDLYVVVGRTRYEECLWHRWRCGRLPLNAHLFRLSLVPSALCPVCHTLETEDHLFYQCALADDARVWLRMECLLLRLPFSDVPLVSDGTSHAGLLFEFLSCSLRHSDYVRHVV